MKFTNTITIDCQPASVFAYLADLENLPQWNYAIRETRKVTTGPIDVGSRYLQIRTIPAYGEERLEVIEFEPWPQAHHPRFTQLLPRADQLHAPPRRKRHHRHQHRRPPAAASAEPAGTHCHAPDQGRGSRQPRRTEANP